MSSFLIAIISQVWRGIRQTSRLASARTAEESRVLWQAASSVQGVGVRLAVLVGNQRAQPGCRARPRGTRAAPANSLRRRRVSSTLPSSTSGMTAEWSLPARRLQVHGHARQCGACRLPWIAGWGPRGSLQGDHPAWPDSEMFVAAGVLLDLSFPAAAARLANLARGGSLTRASVRGSLRWWPYWPGPGLPAGTTKPRRRLSRRATIR